MAIRGFINGRPYTSYAEILEPGAWTQFKTCMEHPSTVKGALMSDAHVGYTLPIGGVVACKDMIFPSFVGYDLGCGMGAIRVPITASDIEPYRNDIFNKLYQVIPTGKGHLNTSPSTWRPPTHPKSDFLTKIFRKKGLKEVGSLGGGNHFIEIGHDEQCRIWVIVHSGSRNTGWRTAQYHMQEAAALAGSEKIEGVFGLPTDSKEGQEYISDLNFCLEMALANRREIIKRTITAVNAFVRLPRLTAYLEDSSWNNGLINRNHNHAELKDGLWIHRKGATHAEAGMWGVIPGNMRDGSFIVKGKGNPDSLYSSSHGAGRRMGRNAIRKQTTVEDFKEAMGTITARIDESTLDESPVAYKNIFDVMAAQGDLVDIHCHVKPIINVKG